MRESMQEEELPPQRVLEVMRRLCDLGRLRGDREQATRYVLGLLFLKYLSDRDHALARDGDLAKLGIALPDAARWEQIERDPTGNTLAHAIDAFDLANAGFGLGELFSSLRRRDVAHLNELLHDMVARVSTLDLASIDAKSLGGVIDDFLQQSAEARWRLGGDSSTPRDLARLLVELVAPTAGSTIYDPTCGTGGLLSAAFEYSQTSDPSASCHVFGQEINPGNAVLARLRLAFHGIPNPQIACGDTLLSPTFVSGEMLDTFDFALCHPPLGLRPRPLYRKHLTADKYNRFTSVVAPTHSWDWLFVEHALASLKSNGRAVIAVTQRALVALNHAAKVREELVRADVIEAVITLPSNALIETRVPSAVLLLNKAKSADRAGRIVFIHASTFDDSGSRRGHISEDLEHQIVSAARASGALSRFSAITTLTEVQSASYSLLPARYVDVAGLNQFLGGSVQWARLSDLADIRTGTQIPEAAIGSGMQPYIQGRDLSKPRLTVDDLKRLNGLENIPEPVFAEEGDVLLQSIHRYSVNPKAYYVSAELAGVMVASTVCVIRLKPPYRHLARYLAEFLNSGKGQSLLYVEAAEATVPTFANRALRRLRIPIVDDPVVSVIDSLREVEDTLLDYISRTRGLRRQLFGVEDPDSMASQLRTLSIESNTLAASLPRI
ncbi:MAG TPA: N-6 DNA methylase, partial [Thermomicrobiaceae bacterium]|nr:N-6 DNA methylase [Thermomicrobiaceae bacterium]